MTARALDWRRVVRSIMPSSAVLARRVSAVVVAAVLAGSVSAGVAAGAAYAGPAEAAAVHAAPAAGGFSAAPVGRSLGGVSCAGPSFCIGVGPYGSQAAGSPTFSQIWNGQAWLPAAAVPSPKLSYSLVAVSCASSRNCLTVGGWLGTGFHDSGQLHGQLSDAWNGSTWRELPVLAGSGPSQLTGVACPAVSLCVAVGQGGPPASTAQSAVWAQLWNGASWSQLAPVDPAGSVASAFSGISCTGPANCVAVGEYATGSAGSEVEHALAESWNGASWTMLPAPPSGIYGLTAISCPTAAVCVVVDSAPGRDRPIGSAVWNGSTWTTLTTPNPVSVFRGQSLTGISCSSATNCVAVGSRPGGPLGCGRGCGPFAERWSGGSSWQLLSVPNPMTITLAVNAENGVPYELAAVSCTSPVSCMAVGGAGAATGTLSSYASFAVSWNGSSWHVLRTGWVDGLMGVSCSSASHCLVTGTYLDPADRTSTLTESWNGKTVRLADRSGIFGVLSEMSCASASFCMAAAEGADIDRWNGTRWTISSSHRPVFGQNPVSNLSCVSRDFCTDGGEFWNGRKWQVSPLVDTNASIGGLSCTRATFCMVVGEQSYYGGGPLAEVWNGKHWRVIATPVGVTGKFTSVSCVTSTDCMAIGSTQPKPDSSDHLIAARWNGRSWLVMHPRYAVGSFDISCPTATSCMAIGSYVRAGAGVNVALSWNGRTWRRTTLPGPGGLNSVSCAAPGQCLAVGLAGIRTLAAAWNGRTWRVIKTLNP